MTFDSDERSVQSGSPIELFKFTGTYNTWRLTNWGRDVTNSDGTYSAAYAIERTEREQGTQEDDTDMDVSIDASHPMVADYAIQEPPPGLLLQIFRAHPADLDDTFKIWEGEVISWNLTGRVAKMRVPSLFSFLLDSPLPRPRYQAPCNHVLGDEFCGVDMTDSANFHDTTIDTISGTSVTLDSNPFSDGECDAGEMIAGDERRMITSNTGLAFTISSPFTSEVGAGDSVTIRRGCDHAKDGDCLNRFDNVINFGGHPLVPVRNPFNERF